MKPALPVISIESHRSIYHKWRGVLEYFDAFIVGLTATPNKQTFGFFNRNLVMGYGHERAVADGVNVDYQVYTIRTKITEQGSRVERGYQVGRRNRQTRSKRWETLSDDLSYSAQQLDRDVVAPDQIRTIIRAFKEALFTDLFPRRKDVPKTLIFAKDDNHAETIVEIVREEFDRGNEFAQKITYKTTGSKPEDLISAFRNSYNPRMAVTVDMISTGTDIKPLEVLLFMRSVKSQGFFEQMKGRGTRTIDDDAFRNVTADAQSKTHFVLVDAVGVYDLRTNQNFTLRNNPLTRAHLDDFVACYSPENRHLRQESERFHSFGYDELLKRDKVSLDLFWLRDESLEDADDLPSPGVLAASIVEDLQAALEQFMAIAEDLNGGTNGGR